MWLRGIDFRPVMNAAGAQGFFEEGYPYDWYWRWLGATFDDCGFVSKTTSWRPRAGNMPLKDDGITPLHWKPACIIVKPWKGVVLNAVSLSGPGAPALVRTNQWQKRVGEPFFISFMPVEHTARERVLETRSFVRWLATDTDVFQSRFGLEINISCPNVKVDPSELVEDVGGILDAARELNVPLQLKFNAVIDPCVACAACEHPACDALVMSNSIPWGALPSRINWKGLFGSDISPLARLDGGGLSGWPLLPIVCDWIRYARHIGFKKPIWACGGIDSCDAIQQAYKAGASGVQLGVVKILRPWRMRRMIRLANELFD